MSTDRPESLWLATAPDEAQFAPQDGDLAVDVAIVGGGIAGLTAAALLKKEGRTVAVIEKDRIAGGETGHTTAHLTEVVDTRYRTLEQDFGEAEARLVAQSSRDAIARIEAFIHEHAIECGFRRVPAWLYAERQEDVDSLLEEREAARRAGMDVQYIGHLPLPFPVKGALRFENQAEFHPREYVLPLARTIPGDGSRVFERTHVHDVEDGARCKVKTSGGVITARDVLVLANVPVHERLFLHTKLYPYRSYAVASRVEEELEGLFWDTESPYHYTRTQRTRDGVMLIVGGEDHKTGTDDKTDERYAKLESYAIDRFAHVGFKRAEYRWSGQIIETADGLPYIGRSPNAEHVWVGTGFSGNGMTLGTLAGMLLTDLAQGRENAYAALYNPSRVKPLAAAVTYLSENVDFPRYFIQDRLLRVNVEAKALEEVGSGEGKIVQLRGEKLAVYRDDGGEVHALSPVCTHLACEVSWNRAERSWDCPCHGSRFSIDGEVINGPAIAPLAKKELPGEDATIERAA
ncbi:MAG TPA: FAD-dependent oxidoreductase [Chloroflexota bacterium]|nr:FAD-dependent oxidoreductase [Chloroflexota bacterium]